MKIKNLYNSANHIIHENIIPIIAVLAIGFWFFGEDTPQPYHEMEMSSSDMAMEHMPRQNRAIKMASFAGRGGGTFPPTPFSNFDPTNPNRKIIKNGNLTIEVQDTEEAKTKAEQKITELEGVITNLNSWEVRPGTLNYNLTIRIPSDKLDLATEELTKLGIKKSENFNTQDITGAYADTENQLKNLKVRRDRLRELMQTETKALKDVLEVDRELSQVQGRIENLERMQKSRDVNVAYSTLNLTLQAETKYGDVLNPQWTVENSWKNAVNKLIQASQDIFDKALELITFTPIWLPILILIFWTYRRFIRKK